MTFGAARIAVTGAAFAAGLALLAPGSAAAADFKLDRANHRPLASGAAMEPGSFSIWSWGWQDDAPDRSPERMTGLTLTFPDGDRPGSGRGFGVGTPRAFGLLGEDVSVSVGAAVMPRSYAPVPDLASVFEPNGGQAGVGGRVSLHDFSFGGAVIGTRRNPLVSLGPQNDFLGGHDIDVSYSFDAGSVSLSHTTNADLLGLNRPGGTAMAVSGRYLLGRNLDMTALFAVEDSGPGDPIAAALEGFALRAGFRLSF